MNKEEKEKLKKIDTVLYGINSYISINYVTGLKKPTKDDMIELNKSIGNILKELRSLGYDGI